MATNNTYAKQIAMAARFRQILTPAKHRLLLLLALILAPALGYAQCEETSDNIGEGSWYEDLEPNHIYHYYDEGGPNSYYPRYQRNQSYTQVVDLYNNYGYPVAINVKYDISSSVVRGYYDYLNFVTPVGNTNYSMMSMMNGQGERTMMRQASDIRFTFYVLPYNYINQRKAGYEITVALCPENTAIQSQVTQITETTALITWTDNSGASRWRIDYGTDSRSLACTTYCNTRQCLLTGLQPSTRYFFNIYDADADDCVSGPCSFVHAKTFRTHCTDNTRGCIDFTDFTSCRVEARSGDYMHPESFGGLVDYGYLSSQSRHTVHRNTGETDARTGGRLRTIPQGYSASVRLGNWEANSEAETMTYEYLVDTNISDLLLLQYAVIMEDADNHTVERQPRFTFQLLDSLGNEIDDGCHSAQFISQNTSGWSSRSYGGSTIRWKDWTPVGIDLSNYHNQRIYIKFMTSDCKIEGHYCYAYFTLECAQKRITSDYCGTFTGATFSAPDGFSYKWYNTANPSNILSTSQQFQAQSEGNYACQMTFVGSNSQQCSFTLNASTESRYPKAEFTLQSLNPGQCTQQVSVTNLSHVCSDAALTQRTTTPCDTYSWSVDNIDLSADDEPTFNLASGTHTITLRASIGTGNCYHTSQQTITISADTAYGTYTETVTENQLPHSYHGHTYTSDTLDTITLASQAVTACDSTIAYQLIVLLNDTTRLDTTVCQSALPIAWRGKSFTQSGTQTLRLTKRNGADSIVVLNLSARAGSTTDTRAQGCSGHTLNLHGSNITSSGNYTFTLQDTAGCDSVVNYTVTFVQAYRDTVSDTIPDSQLPHTYGGETFYATTLMHPFQYTSQQGCDSTVYYNLIAYHSDTIRLDTTVCNGHYPFTWHGKSYARATADTLHLRNHAGFDSTVILKISMPFVDTTIIANSICRGSSVDFGGTTYTQTGSYRTTYASAANGCDSVIQLDLLVSDTFTVNISDTIADSQLPYTYGGVTFNATTLRHLFHLTSQQGCDSLVYYSLVAHHFDTISFDTNVCNGHFPLLWHGNTYHEAATDTLHLRSLDGFDSIVILNISIPFIDTTVIDTALCKGQSLNIDMFRFSETGNYEMLYSSHTYGCDSVVRLNIQVNETFSYYVYDTIEESDLPWYWNGHYFKTPVVNQLYEYKTSQGCDSLVYYTTRVYHKDTTVFDTVVCPEDTPITWHGETFTATDTRRQHYLNIMRKDSLVVVNLRVQPVSIGEQRVLLCQGSSYTCDTTTITASGVYTFRLKTPLGCDSLHYLSVVVNPVSAKTVHQTISDTALPYHFNHHVYTSEATDDTLHLLNRYGCDSLITFSLTITLHRLECDQTLQFPNLVTANGDGYNDIFVIRGLVENDCYPSNSLRIYNRWGKLIYHKQNIQSLADFWDPAADNAPAGTYFYTFQASGIRGSMSHQGTIELIR